MQKPTLTFLVLFAFILRISAQKNDFAILAYYDGNAAQIDKHPVEKLTHIIYSFCHLKGNQLAVDNADDSLTIRHLTSLKTRNPKLKIILALGGWGGCKTCSEVFSSKKGRSEFVRSVKQIMETYQTDGLDLDWEYPAIEGHPGHPWSLADKRNFTLLTKELRKKLGWKYELSFAAGGFPKFLEQSVEWSKIMPLLDRVNLMSYDLVHGYSTRTGHHTPLYSTPSQVESADQAVRFLDSIGVPLNKVVIGAAFYGRVWENVPDMNNGLYQPGKFKRAVSYNKLEQYLLEHNFEGFTDEVSKSPYMYSKKEQLFLTYDSELSVALKTKYAKQKGLNGIMFWQLGEDITPPHEVDKLLDKNLSTQGLLDAIYRAAE